MKQLITFVEKEFRHVFRDRKTLLTLIGLPIVQLVLFGFALTNELKNSKIIICDYSKDCVSQRIIAKFQASNQFSIVQSPLNYTQIETAFRQGEIKMAVVIPAQFNSDLFHQNKAQIQLIIDASDPNVAAILSGYASQIIGRCQSEIVQFPKTPYLINSQVRMIYNPELKATVNFVPGVISLILLLVCVLMTSVSIVKEKENGTMEVLLVSPLNPLLVILSKMLPYLGLSLVNLTAVLAVSVLVLDVPINGSIALLYGVSTLFIITALSLGLLISNVTASQQSAMLISLMAMLVPSILFTGFMFPLENMHYLLQLVSHVVPSKWFYIIVKSIMIKGLGFSAIWKETMVLIAMTLVLLAINIRKFKIRLL